MTEDRATTGTRRANRVPGFDKQTRQREAVLRSLNDHTGFISAQALYSRLRTSGERIGLSTRSRRPARPSRPMPAAVGRAVTAATEPSEIQ